MFPFMRIHGNNPKCVLLSRRRHENRHAARKRRSARKATHVTLAEALLAEAKAKSLNINISQAAEAGLARAVTERRAELWLAENREALESSNAYVEESGLPLARYRKF